MELRHPLVLVRWDDYVKSTAFWPFDIYPGEYAKFLRRQTEPPLHDRELLEAWLDDRSP